ncbi:MAG: ribosome biogenesis GTP-binding protein YihA/YsxC [Chitinophagaceae bacterium]
MEVKEAKYLISSANYQQCPKADRPEYAFIGRSNVGKSSLINMICNNKNLAKTSSAPGKTQLLNHFEIISSDVKEKNKNVKWYLVDLPGYGYAKVSQSSRRRWEQMIEEYIRKRENLACLFVLIDSRHEPQQADLDFIDQLGKWQIPFVIVFTKTDKNKPGANDRNTKAFLSAMMQHWEGLPPYFLTSAITKEGREGILEYIGNLNSGYEKL